MIAQVVIPILLVMLLMLASILIVEIIRAFL
jgi:hypothetical protein